MTVAVKAYSRVNSGHEMELHQLHRDCGQRIRQQKYCPDHGVLEAADIVKGYEYAPNQHLVLDDADLTRLRPANEKLAPLNQFIDEGQVDGALFSGRSFFLVADGPAAQRPYAVLAEVLRQRRKWGVGLIVMYGRRSPIVIRPAGRVLAMDLLQDPALVKDPIEGSLSPVTVTDEELTLAGSLVDSVATPVRWTDYQDDTAQKFAALIEAKLQGHATVDAPPEEIVVLPLLDALRQSLGKIPEAKTTRDAGPTRSRKRKPPKPA